MFKSITKKPRNRVTMPASTPAPTGGLNSRDPPSERGPQFADTLTNFVCSPNGVAVREGFRNYATGITGFVETLMPYSASGNFQDRMFAAAGSKIVDVTDPGTAITTGSVTQSGLNSALWSHTNFTGAEGHFLIVTNGVDAMRHWNGQNWVVWTTVANATAPGHLVGIGADQFDFVISHQKRLWFVQKNSTKAWYLPINSVGGEAKAFDFGAQFPRGGKLVALNSWSLNGGTGMQNYLVAISSNGDVVIYEGTDPSDGSKWSTKGVWQLGPPVSNRCFLRFGGDSLLLTQDGLIPLSKYMQSTSTRDALTDTIRDTISRLTTSQAGLPGFQIHDHLSRNLLILNIPQINPNQNLQFIYNTITGGWSLFEGWPAQCWATLGNAVYFGANGKVCLAFVGFKDNADAVGNGGDVYTALALQSANDFQKPGQRKRFVRAKVNMRTAVGIPNVRLDCNVDFATKAPASIGSAVPNTAAAWDTALWNRSEWAASGLSNYNEWQSLGPIGNYGAISMAVSVLAETMWISTDWEIELGGNR
jgi:hypothetical protein